jgi:hypothetical protein
MIEHPSIVPDDVWERAPHEHCRCGSRLLPMEEPWEGPLCLACGHDPGACSCRDRTCESCGWGPT